MQKVVGSSPISRFVRKPRSGGAFCLWNPHVGGVAALCVGGAGAHWCPIATLDKRAKPVTLVLAAPHRVGVHPERERRVGVAELSDRVAHRPVERREDGGECVPQPVRGEALWRG